MVDPAACADTRYLSSELGLGILSDPALRLCACCGTPEPRGAALGATEPELLACGRCKRACYCGTDCQRSQWFLHKLGCRTPPEAAEYPPREAPAPALAAASQRFFAACLERTLAAAPGEYPLPGGASPLVVLAAPDSPSTALSCCLAALQSIAPLRLSLMRKGGLLAELLAEMQSAGHPSRVSADRVRRACPVRGEGIDDADFNCAFSELCSLAEPAAPRSPSSSPTAYVCTLCSKPWEPTGGGVLVCGHFFHPACLASHPGPSGLCPQCGAESPSNLVRIKIPSSFKAAQGEAFDFCVNSVKVDGCKGLEAWTLKPGGVARACDIITVRLGTKNALLPPKLDFPLEAAFNAAPCPGSMCPLFISESIDCRVCGCARSFGEVHENVLRIYVPAAALSLLERLLQPDLMPSFGCTSCIRNMSSGWCWSGVDNCWVSIDDLWGAQNVVPTPSSWRTYLLSAPPVLDVQVVRAGFDDMFSAGAVSFPVNGLDVAGMFPSQYQPPVGSCTIYDLRLIVLFGNRSLSAAGKLIEAAMQGRPLHVKWGLYIALAKSLADERWYYSNTFDRSGSPCRAAFLDGAARVTSNNVSSLVYVRRDVATLEAQLRPTSGTAAL